MYRNIGYRFPDGTFVREMTSDGDDLDSRMTLYTDAAARQRLRTFPTDVEKYITAYLYSDDSNDAELSGDFYLDLDSKDDVHLAHEEAKQIVDLLRKYIPDQFISIYFTGSKGFNILVSGEIINRSDKNLNHFYKFIASQIKKQLSLTTVDMVIYDRSRLLRIPNSWNAKGGRYKIGITIDTLLMLDTESIIEMAATPSDVSFCLLDEPEREDLEKAAAFFDVAWKLFQREQESASTHYAEEIRRLPDGVEPPCVEALKGKVLSEGEGRNRALWVLGMHWKRQGIDMGQVGERLHLVNQHYTPPLNDKEFRSILRSVGARDRAVGCSTIELSECCPGRSECWYFTSAKAPPPDHEIPPPVQDEDGIRRYSFDGFQYELSNVNIRQNSITAQVSITGNGVSRISRVNLLSTAHVSRFLARLPQRETISEHLGTITQQLSQEIVTPENRRVATEREIEHVQEHDGRYWARRVGRDGSVTWEPITNFTMTVTRLLYELDPYGSTTCVRECVLSNCNGSRSQPRRAKQIDFATKPGFVSWCNGSGDFSFSGSDADLQYLKEERLFTTEVRDEAIVLDHIGHISAEPGMFLWKNAGVHHGRLILSDGVGTFTVGDKHYQLRGLDLANQWGPLRGVPEVNVNYVNDNKSLADVKSQLLRLLRSNLFDYRGWVALGLTYAALYLPEIEEVYHQFPGLFLAGPMGSGKNTMLRWIQGAVGMKTNIAISLPRVTLPALERWMAYHAGLPIVMDEFRNTNDVEGKVHLLRDWYDRIGRSVAVRNESTTMSRPVRGWMVIAGQDISTDAAFRSRFITLVMQGRTRSSDQSMKGEIDRLVEQSGSAIALDVLMKKTPEEVGRFMTLLGKSQGFYQRRLTAVTGFERTAYNYAVATAGLNAAFHDVISTDDMTKFAVWCVDQTELRTIESEETSDAMSFMQDIVSMIAQDYIQYGEHYHIEDNADIKDFGLVHKALYLWLPGIQRAWARYKGYADGRFSDTGLLYALEGESSFVTKNYQKYFRQGVQHKCVVLDMNKLRGVTSEEFKRGV